MITDHLNYGVNDIVEAYWLAGLKFHNNQCQSHRIASRFPLCPPMSRAVLVTFCVLARISLSACVEFTSLDRTGCASWHIGALCDSCRRWGIQALSVVNTRVIIVAGHLGPQARHIRSLTIQSLRSKLRLINNSETMGTSRLRLC